MPTNSKAGVILKTRFYALTLAIVHTQMYLGLRHPNNQGPSNAVAHSVILRIGDKLYREECITMQEWERMRADRGASLATIIPIPLIDVGKANQIIHIHFSVQELVTIHANVSLALHHTSNTGATLPRTHEALTDIESNLFRVGYISQDELNAIQQDKLQWVITPQQLKLREQEGPPDK